jgi:hypothetical protein
MDWGQGLRCRWALVFSVALLAACSSMTPVEPTAPVSKHILQKNFAVGELKSAAVGETMVSLKDYYEKGQQNVWSVGQPATLRVGLGSMVLVAGDYAASGRVKGGGSVYDVVAIKVHPFELTTLSPSSAVVLMTFLIDDSGHIVRSGGGLGITTEVSDLHPADFRATRAEKTNIDARRSYSNFELLYSGVAAGAVRLTSREYAPTDLAHPSQFQDLTYNLSDKSVRFKDVLLEIESADNQRIRFRVKSVPQDWMSAAQP